MDVPKQLSLEGDVGVGRDARGYSTGGIVAYCAGTAEVGQRRGQAAPHPQGYLDPQLVSAVPCTHVEQEIS